MITAWELYFNFFSSPQWHPCRYLKSCSISAEEVSQITIFIWNPTRIKKPCHRNLEHGSKPSCYNSCRPSDNNTGMYSIQQERSSNREITNTAEHNSISVLHRQIGCHAIDTVLVDAICTCSHSHIKPIYSSITELCKNIMHTWKYFTDRTYVQPR